MKFTKQIFSLLFIACLMIGCSPEDGKDGAPGPQGEQGDQGPQGDQGDQGDTGTANVIYSDWIVSEFPDNIITISGGFNVDAPDVTQAIIDNGVFLGFAKNIPLAGTPTVSQLPRISGDNQYSISLQNPGTVRFSASSIDGGSVGTTVYEEYRYILIPGGVSASARPSGNTTPVDYTSMSYEEIIDYFNIPN